MPARLVVYPADGHQPGSPTDDKTRADRPRRAGRCCPGRSPRIGRPAGALPLGLRGPGGMAVAPLITGGDPGPGPPSLAAMPEALTISILSPTVSSSMSTPTTASAPGWAACCSISARASLPRRPARSHRTWPDPQRRIHPEHPLDGDHTQVLGRGAALDPGGGGDEHRHLPATIQAVGRPWAEARWAGGWESGVF
jgi:hypothetical protein